MAAGHLTFHLQFGHQPPKGSNLHAMNCTPAELSLTDHPTLAVFGSFHRWSLIPEMAQPCDATRGTQYEVLHVLLHRTHSCCFAHHLRWRYLPCKGYSRGYALKIWLYIVQYLHLVLKFPLTHCMPGGIELFGTVFF